MINQVPRKQILESMPEAKENTKNQDMFFEALDNNPKPPYRPMEMQHNKKSMPMDTVPQTSPGQGSSPSTGRQRTDMPQGTSQPGTPSPYEGTTQLPDDINLTGTPIGLPVFDPEFTQGYLRQNIGKRVRVEFLIGTGTLIDRTGRLVDVGISYIIINPVETDDLMLCDIYSIKFVTFFG